MTLRRGYAAEVEFASQVHVGPLPLLRRPAAATLLKQPRDDLSQLTADAALTRAAIRAATDQLFDAEAASTRIFSVPPVRLELTLGGF